MRLKVYHVMCWFVLLLPSATLDEPDEDQDLDQSWEYSTHKPQSVSPLTGPGCSAVKPSARDIVKRFYAILPYFDKDHANSAFLHKLRGTIYAMADGEDMLDREAAFFATVLTPIVFLKNYRDSWCLMERFHRALRLYQVSHPTEKRSSLKLLQNLRDINQKIRSFVSDLPTTSSAPFHLARLSPPPDPDDDELHDKKDIKYLKELIKNLG